MFDSAPALEPWQGSIGSNPIAFGWELSPSPLADVSGNFTPKDTKELLVPRVAHC